MADDNVSAPKTHKMALDKEKASLLDYASTLAPFCWTNTLLNSQQAVLIHTVVVMAANSLYQATLKGAFYEEV